MNVNQITAFHAVMTSASLSEAARKLGRTQPAVSTAIKTLEDQLGLKLFTRTGRKLVPVPEAQYLLTETSAILDQLTRVRRTMKTLVDGQTGSLRVATMPGPAAMLFPRFIASKIKPDADTSISIMSRNSAQIAELARAQNIDFGFADALSDPMPEDLYRTEIISAQCFVALSVDDPLAGKDVIGIEDLDGRPMGSLLSSHTHRRDLAARFQAAGAQLQVLVESQAFLQTVQFVSEGLCCAVIDPLSIPNIKASPDLMRTVTIRPLSCDLRYRYAIYQPRYHPISVLAQQIKIDWRNEVMRMLEEVGARPQIHVQDPDSEALSEQR